MSVLNGSYVTEKLVNGTWVIAVILRGTYEPGVPYVDPTPRRYVDQDTGSDSNSGLYGAPWETLTYAAAHAPTGASIYIMGGTYNERMVMSHSQAVIGFADQTVIIDGSGIAMEHTSYRGGVEFRGTSTTHISSATVRNVTVQNWGEDGWQHCGIVMMYVDTIDIDHCNTSNTMDCGIFIHACGAIGGGIIQYNAVANADQNTVSDMDEQLSVAASTGLVISHNTITNTTPGLPYVNAAICVKTSSSYCTIEDNIIDGSTGLSMRGGVLVDAWTSDCHDIIVRRNIITHVLNGVSPDAEGPAGAGHLKNCWIYNNIIWDFGYCGIGFNVVGDGLRENIYVYNNTISKATDNGGSAIIVKTANLAGDIHIKNNISDVEEGVNGQIRCLTAAVAKCTFANNIAWGVNSYATDPVTDMPEISSGETRADPLIINRNDPTTTATFLKVYAESPCNNTGADLSATFTTDYLGAARTAWDIGAINATATAAPTPNVIFTADFEANDLSEFPDASSGTGITVSAGAAMADSDYGANINIPNTTAKYVSKSGLNNTTYILDVRLYIDPNTLTMTTGDNFGFVVIQNTAGDRLFFVLLVKDASNYAVQIGHYIDAGTPVYDTNVDLVDGPNYVEFQAVRASGAGAADGTIAIRDNGVLMTGITDMDLYTRWGQVDKVFIGAGLVISIPATTTGDFFLDKISLSDNTVWQGAAA